MTIWFLTLVYRWEILCRHYFRLRRLLPRFSAFCIWLQDSISSAVDCWGGCLLWRQETKLNSWSMIVGLMTPYYDWLNIESVWRYFTGLAWWPKGVFTEDPFWTCSLFTNGFWITLLRKMNHLSHRICSCLADFRWFLNQRDSISNWICWLRSLEYPRAEYLSLWLWSSKLCPTPVIEWVLWFLSGKSLGCLGHKRSSYLWRLNLRSRWVRFWNIGSDSTLRRSSLRAREINLFNLR